MEGLGRDPYNTWAEQTRRRGLVFEDVAHGSSKNSRGQIYRGALVSHPKKLYSDCRRNSYITVSDLCLNA